MNRPPNWEEDSGKLPEGWEPERDADARWKGISMLLREADAPREPGMAAFEQVRVAIRAELELDRRAPVQPVEVGERRDAFFPWVRQILVGGGPGAQALRLAAAGLVGFLLAQGMVKQPAERATAAPAHEIAMAPAKAVIPAGFDYLDRSGLDAAGQMKAGGQAVADLGLASATMPADSWYAYSHFGGPRVSTVSASDGQPAVELLQQIRANALVSNDLQSVEAVRRLEERLEPLMRGQSGLSRQESETLAMLRQGEELAAKGFAREALDSYAEAKRLSPGSFMAYLADFQSARLNYEVVQDYETALRQYRGILEEYPRQYLSARHLEHVKSRIELLAGNYERDWQALRLWQQAQNAPAEKRPEILNELLVRAPESPLAREAVRQLAQSSPDGPMRADKLIELLDAAIAASEGSPRAANLQFSKAEIINQHLGDPARAAEEYRKVLAMPGSQALQARVALRLEQLGKN